MPLNLGQQEFITLVADADTPANLVAWANVRIGIPVDRQDELPPLGTIDSITVENVGTVWGYLRRDTVGNLQFVMAAPVNPNVTAINAIPSAGAWTDLAARSVYYTIGQALLGFGVSGPDLRTGLQQLYAAAVANATAEAAAQP
jgi:hypothetical protein